MARNAWHGNPGRADETVDSAVEKIEFPIPEGLTAQDVSRIIFYLEKTLLSADSYCLTTKELITKTMAADSIVKSLMFRTQIIDVIIDWMVENERCEKTYMEDIATHVITITQSYLDKLPEHMKHLGENAAARIHTAETKKLLKSGGEITYDR